jgi:hypothetical protein
VSFPLHGTPSLTVQHTQYSITSTAVPPLKRPSPSRVFESLYTQLIDPQIAHASWGGGGEKVELVTTHPKPDESLYVAPAP